jgi:aminobenzoyl-glutamate utilization protein B
VEFSTAAYPLGTPGHSWQRVACSRVGLGHKSLIFAAKVMASVILELFTQPEQLARVKKEFEERTKGAKYVPPIPKDLKPPFNQLPQYAAKK